MKAKLFRIIPVKEREIEYILKDCTPKIVVCEETLVPWKKVNL